MCAIAKVGRLKWVENKFFHRPVSSSPRKCFPCACDPLTHVRISPIFLRFSICPVLLRPTLIPRILIDNLTEKNTIFVSIIIIKEVQETRMFSAILVTKNIKFIVKRINLITLSTIIILIIVAAGSKKNLY